MYETKLEWFITRPWKPRVLISLQKCKKFAVWKANILLTSIPVMIFNFHDHFHAKYKNWRALKLDYNCSFQLIFPKFAPQFSSPNNGSSPNFSVHNALSQKIQWNAGAVSFMLKSWVNRRINAYENFRTSRNSSTDWELKKRDTKKCLTG